MSLLPKIRNAIALIALIALYSIKADGQHIYPQDADKYFSPVAGEQAIGHWDMTVSTPSGLQSSWLEIAKSGTVLVGRFVGFFCSVRPISLIKYSKDTKEYSFTIPPQCGTHDLQVKFKLDGENKLEGWESNLPDGKKLAFTAERAPDLLSSGTPQWGKPIFLLKNGLADWTFKGKNWTFSNGVLTDDGSGGDITTKQKFNDFKLHVEFRYTKNSNSGIYLRGRYELQILDSYGMHPESHEIGGIYGFVTPAVNAAYQAGQWQTFDVMLIGRMVTVRLNGVKIICDRPIPGITGGAIDSHEGEPGPIILQGGEVGHVEFRNIVLTPAK